ncbi:hypothetical protein [Mycolicibacterium sphagni]|uniref:PE-PPE domain-containing protein n=1 Tax=Mycolicibacterium sphagni TaxID=1786 RepID=A0ABX2K754_9MYCO|nr:hypothetical protein [Mycolicibacterium sphagni]NTY63929.1 hypothetical protein [Mycolicibacterium sphagni]
MLVQSAGARSLLTSGTALAVAGVLAASMISPPHHTITATRITVAAPALRLTAAPSPLEFYPQVAQRTLSNVGALAGEYAVVVPALAGAIVTNPVGVLRSAAAVAPMLALFSPLLVPGYALAAVSPLLSGVAAAGLSLTEIGDAVKKGDPVDLVNAVVNIPARIVDGLLNGGVPGAPFYSIGVFTAASGNGPSPLGLPGVIAQMVLTGAGIQFPDPYQPPWVPSASSSQRTMSAATSARVQLKGRGVTAVTVHKDLPRAGTANPAPRSVKKPGGDGSRSATGRPARTPSGRG